MTLGRRFITAQSHEHYIFSEFYGKKRIHFSGLKLHLLKKRNIFIIFWAKCGCVFKFVLIIIKCSLFLSKLLLKLIKFTFSPKNNRLEQHKVSNSKEKNFYSLNC